VKRRGFLFGTLAVGVTALSPALISRAAEPPVPGTIITVAGTGQDGFSGDKGPAAKARLSYPIGIAIDAAGNVFIGDGANSRVRKVSPDGIITTVAGSGPTGPDKGIAAGDGGPALAATLRGPYGLAVDGSGNLFLTELDPGGTLAYTGPRAQVRKVSADGVITTVVGSGVRGFSGDGGKATAARLSGLLGVAVDTAGNLFVADSENYRVRKVDANGIITTVAGMGQYRYAGDGILATTTGLRGPIGVAVDAAGNLVFTDTGHEINEADGLGYNERVLKVFGVAAPGLLAGMPFPKPQ
jgi:NHL repeat-containing protein